MADIRTVTENFAVAPQLEPADLEIAKAAGFKTIICNRPDAESGPDQPTIEQMRQAAEPLGLTFLALPFAGMPSNEIADQQRALLDNSPTPVLAYCRSGTRSITAWALSQSGSGEADAIVEAAANAGYDLSGLSSKL